MKKTQLTIAKKPNKVSLTKVKKHWKKGLFSIMELEGEFKLHVKADAESDQNLFHLPLEKESAQNLISEMKLKPKQGKKFNDSFSVVYS